MEYVALSSVDPTQPGEERDDQMGLPGRPRRRGRAFGIVLAMLAVVIVAVLVPVWVKYGTLNPSTGRLSPIAHPWYFPVLMVHIASATLALTTCVLQVWPWLRRRHPRVHRYVGRVYVFAGVYPAGFTVLVLVAFWPTSTLTSFNQVLVGLLWLCVTTYGLVLARQGRTADHRRMMLRSFAVTTSVLVNEVVFPPIYVLFKAQLHTQLAGSQFVLLQMSNATDNWLGFTLAFIAVEWWLEREQLRRSVRRQPGLSPNLKS